jgi:hypothetical protein
MLGMGTKTTAETFNKHAALVNAHNKVYVVNEYGWDVTDWPTHGDLAHVLDTMETNKNIVGDLFWALQAHADNNGWQPIPASVNNLAYDRVGEAGQWWALYYGGVSTLVHDAADMQARAELLRAHAFKMTGLAVPPHPTPTAPVITFKGLQLVAWHGSVGAVRYTVQRQSTPEEPWKTVCDRCATDADTPWVDPTPATNLLSTRYRVLAVNADGAESAPSEPR